MTIDLKPETAQASFAAGVAKKATADGNPRSLSLASLFSLTTAVAVLLTTGIHFPGEFGVIVAMLVPGVIRGMVWAETCAAHGRILTVTERLLDVIGAGAVCGITFVAVCFVFLQTLLPLAAIAVHADELGAVLLLIALLCAVVTGVALCWLVLTEMWWYAWDVVANQSRFPTTFEQVRQVLRTMSIVLFLQGATLVSVSSIVLPFVGEASGGEPMLPFFALIALGAACLAAGYWIVHHHFQNPRVRLSAGLYVALPGAMLAGIAEFSRLEITAGAVLICLFIWQPLGAWPANFPQPMLSPAAPEED